MTDSITFHDETGAEVTSEDLDRLAAVGIRWARRGDQWLMPISQSRQLYVGPSDSKIQLTRALGGAVIAEVTVSAGEEVRGFRELIDRFDAGEFNHLI